MQEKKAVVKMEGEKLLKLTLTEKNRILESVNLSGDFFVFPEEKIKIIEESLVGLTVNKTVIVTILEKVILRNKIELVGISPKTIADAILAAQ